jgi:hypothetical protein
MSKEHVINDITQIHSFTLEFTCTFIKYLYYLFAQPCLLLITLIIAFQLKYRLRYNYNKSIYISKEILHIIMEMRNTNFTKIWCSNNYAYPFIWLCTFRIYSGEREMSNDAHFTRDMLIIREDAGTL